MMERWKNETYKAHIPVALTNSEVCGVLTVIKIFMRLSDQLSIPQSIQEESRSIGRNVTVDRYTAIAGCKSCGHWHKTERLAWECGVKQQNWIDEDGEWSCTRYWYDFDIMDQRLMIISSYSGRQEIE